jgi:PIN domain nuclease of toxin-antitoxin system
MPSADSPLVLDTHYWLWVAAADWKKFTGREKRALESAARHGLMAISIISVWEAGVLESKGKLRLKEQPAAWLKRICGLPGLQILPITPEIAWESSHLPGAFHGDPADRIIVATARAHGARLLTRDDAILRYSEMHYVKTL